MANFTEAQIQSMLTDLNDEFGSEIATRELAVLELEDMKRKGCALEFANRFNDCHGCSIAHKCPVLDWQKRHPEYANDELAMKIKVLEAGGEEAYNAKLKAQEDAKKKAEELANKEKEAVDLASKMETKVILMACANYSSDELKQAIESYVQQRIHLALKYGKSSIAETEK